MFYQTDKKIKELFDASSDCYFFCILRIYELISGVTLTRSEIKDIRKIAVKAKFITIEGYINENGIQGIASIASAMRGYHVYMELVSNNYLVSHQIGKFVRTTNSGKLVTHFIVVDNTDKIIYDPWSLDGSRTGKIGVIESYRFIFTEKI